MNRRTRDGCGYCHDGRSHLLLGTLTAALLITLTLGGAGCRSPQGPQTDSLAAVEIRGGTPVEIARAVSDVFQKAGYVPVPLPSNKGEKMMFEREGSAGSTVLYGDWTGKRVWYRVRVHFTPTGPDSEVVSCDAFRVLNHGDPHFEEEQKLSGLGRSPYRKLLEKAKARFIPAAN